MSFWQFLNQWWNLPYLVMLGLVGVFFGLQAVGLVAHLGEGDVDADADVDHELEHDHDVDHDNEQEHDHESAPGLASFLGVGRVPFMVVWLTLFIFSGFSGIFFNRFLFVKAGSYTPWFFPLSLLASLVTGVFAVRFAARGVQKLVDVGGRGASARRELTGRIGVVASPQLDAQFGEVRVRDDRGNELLVHCRLGAADAPLKQGEQVVLVESTEDGGVFTATALKN